MNVLIVDDNRSLARGLSTFLKQEGHEAAVAASLAEGLSLLARYRYDLVITDLKLPDGLGLELIRTARSGPQPPDVILMTAFGTVETAVEAMKLGALDYLIKPVPLEEFAFRIDRVVRLRQANQRAESLARENQDLLQARGLASPLDELVGDSSGMKSLKETIRKAAPFPSTVLITGETGAGKEMVARAIHALSPRSGKPFVRVNCASIPDALFEAELFGHEKGAFTDAHERRIGTFEAADGGTLFLDEVGEVPVHLQAKLLRVIQEKEFTRIGSSRPQTVDVRIVAATNRDLERMTQTAAFREDLLYRLSVVRVAVPPLRQRVEDLQLLAEHLLERFRQEFGRPGLHLPPEAVAALSRREWRGNVRELRNALERAVVLAESDRLESRLFEEEREPAPGRHAERTALPPDGLLKALDDEERRMIRLALDQAQGVKARAAEFLKIPRTNLLYRLKRLGLAESADDGEAEPEK